MTASIGSRAVFTLSIPAYPWLGFETTTFCLQKQYFTMNYLSYHWEQNLMEHRQVVSIFHTGFVKWNVEIVSFAWTLPNEIVVRLT